MLRRSKKISFQIGEKNALSATAKNAKIKFVLANIYSFYILLHYSASTHKQGHLSNHTLSNHIEE